MADDYQLKHSYCEQKANDYAKALEFRNCLTEHAFDS